MEKNVQSKNKIDKQTMSRIIVCSIVILIIIVLSIFAIFYMNRNSGKNGMANIYQNGKLIQTIDLSIHEDEDIIITGSNNCTNTIRIKDHDICMHSASCPDKLCVKEGYASNSLLPIVCLPNNIVITVNYPAQEETLDAISY